MLIWYMVRKEMGISKTQGHCKGYGLFAFFFWFHLQEKSKNPNDFKHIYVYQVSTKMHHNL